MWLRERSPQLVIVRAAPSTSHSRRHPPWPTHGPGGPAGRSPNPQIQTPPSSLLQGSSGDWPRLCSCHQGHSIP